MIKNVYTMYINCTFGKWNIFIKNTNYEKTDKLNFNSTIKFSNDLLNDKQPNQTKEWLKKHLVYWLD
jgi:hypothetical protein